MGKDWGEEMPTMNLTELLRRAGLEKAYAFLDRDPEQNIPRLLDWMEKLDWGGVLRRRAPLLRQYLQDPNSNWSRLARSLWDDVDGEVRKTLFTALAVHSGDAAMPDICPLPILGADGFDALDELVETACARGHYIYSAVDSGEPLFHQTLIALCNEYADCVFFLLTEGERVDDRFAEELLRVKNCIPALLDPETAAADRAMACLKRRRLLFGGACWAADLLDGAGERLADGVIRGGGKFLWRLETNDLAERQAEWTSQLREFRRSKPLFLLCDSSGCRPKSENDESRLKTGPAK